MKYICSRHFKIKKKTGVMDGVPTFQSFETTARVITLQESVYCPIFDVQLSYKSQGLGGRILTQKFSQILALRFLS